MISEGAHYQNVTPDLIPYQLKYLTLLYVSWGFLLLFCFCYFQKKSWTESRQVCPELNVWLRGTRAGIMFSSNLTCLHILDTWDENINSYWHKL